MGGEIKPLISLGEQPLIDHVITLAKPQVSRLVLSINQHHSHFEYLNLPIIADAINPAIGPLSGIVSSMQWYRENDETLDDDTYLACFPADVPRFPADSVSQLVESVLNTGSDAAIFETNGQVQPLFSVWRFRVLETLKRLLESGLAGPKLVLPHIEHTLIRITTSGELEFFNINSPTDLAIAQKMIKNSEKP